jgi:hypothetical protein
MPNFLIDEDTGLLAAEFVLGTLDSAERANAHSLLKTDHGFIAMVRIWERRFGDLHLMVEPVEPDAKILARIKAKLPAVPGEPAAATQDAEKPPAPPPPSVEPPKPAAVGPEAVAAPPVSPSVTAEAPKPPEPAKPPEPPVAAPAVGDVTAPPVRTLPPAPDFPPAWPPEDKPKTAALPKAGAVPAPPPQPPPSLKLLDKPLDRLQDRRLDRRSEVTIDVIRSRRRWRAFGIFMILLACGLAGLVAAWRIVPDRLPPMLRPAAVMAVIGIEPGSATPEAPGRKPAPPESQFDE